MNSLNGNLLAAVDTETTGLVPGFHELIEVAIVPLDFVPAPNPYAAFTVTIKPAHPERADSPYLTKERLTYLMEHGKSEEEAYDLFEKWLRSLTLWGNIAPLGHNYAFDRGFLREWLGADFYEAAFDYHYRDTQVVAAYLNDIDALYPRQLRFPHTNLKGLCEKLGVENKQAHSALADAVATASCYLRLIRGA